MIKGTKPTLSSDSRKTSSQAMSVWAKRLTRPILGLGVTAVSTIGCSTLAAQETDLSCHLTGVAGCNEQGICIWSNRIGVDASLTVKSNYRMVVFNGFEGGIAVASENNLAARYEVRWQWNAINFKYMDIRNAPDQGTQVFLLSDDRRLQFDCFEILGGDK